MKKMKQAETNKGGLDNAEGKPQGSSYVAMIARIIRAVTGLARATMGFVSRGRSSRLKSLDLWLDLRKAVNVLEADLLRVEKLMEQANHSREAIAVAKGMSGSGQMMEWKQNLEADRKEVRQLFEKSPAFEEDYHVLTVQMLESTLTKVRRLQARANELRWTYESALRAGDEEKRQLGGPAEAHTRSAGPRKNMRARYQRKIDIDKEKNRFRPVTIEEILQNQSE